MPEKICAFQCIKSLKWGFLKSKKVWNEIIIWTLTSLSTRATLLKDFFFFVTWNWLYLPLIAPPVGKNGKAIFSPRVDIDHIFFQHVGALLPGKGSYIPWHEGTCMFRSLLCWVHYAHSMYKCKRSLIRTDIQVDTESCGFLVIWKQLLNIKLVLW